MDQITALASIIWILFRQPDSNQESSPDSSKPAREYVSTNVIVTLLDKAQVTSGPGSEEVRQRLVPVRRRPTAIKIRSASEVSRLLHELLNGDKTTRKAHSKFVSATTDIVVIALSTSSESLWRVCVLDCFLRAKAATKANSGETCDIDSALEGSIPREEAAVALESSGIVGSSSNVDAVKKCFPPNLFLSDFEEFLSHFFADLGPLFVNALFVGTQQQIENKMIHDKSCANNATEALAALAELRLPFVCKEIVHSLDGIDRKEQVRALVRREHNDPIMLSHCHRDGGGGDRDALLTLVWAVRLLVNILSDEASKTTADTTLAGIRLFTAASRLDAWRWFVQAAPTLLLASSQRSNAEPAENANAWPAALYHGLLSTYSSASSGSTSSSSSSASLKQSIAVIALIATTNDVNAQFLAVSQSVPIPECRSLFAALSKLCLLQAERLSITHGFEWPPSVPAGAAAAVAEMVSKTQLHQQEHHHFESGDRGATTNHDHLSSPSRRLLMLEGENSKQSPVVVASSPSPFNDNPGDESEMMLRKLLQLGSSNGDGRILSRVAVANKERLRNRMKARFEEQHAAAVGAASTPTKNKLLLDNFNPAASASLSLMSAASASFDSAVDARARSFVLVTLCSCRNVAAAYKYVQDHLYSKQSHVDSDANVNTLEGRRKSRAKSIAAASAGVKVPKVQCVVTNRAGLSLLTTPPVEVPLMSSMPDSAEFDAVTSRMVVPYSSSSLLDQKKNHKKNGHNHDDDNSTLVLRLVQPPSPFNPQSQLVARKTWQLPSNHNNNNERERERVAVLKLEVPPLPDAAVHDDAGEENVSAKKQMLAAEASAFLGVELTYLRECIPFYPSRVTDSTGNNTCWLQITVERLCLISKNRKGNNADNNSLNQNIEDPFQLSNASVVSSSSFNGVPASPTKLKEALPTNDEMDDAAAQDQLLPLHNFLFSGFGEVELRVYTPDEFPIKRIAPASIAQESLSVKWDRAAGTFVFPMAHHDELIIEALDTSVLAAVEEQQQESLLRSREDDQQKQEHDLSSAVLAQFHVRSTVELAKAGSEVCVAEKPRDVLTVDISELSEISKRMMHDASSGDNRSLVAVHLELTAVPMLEV